MDAYTVSSSGSSFCTNLTDRSHLHAESDETNVAGATDVPKSSTAANAAAAAAARSALGGSRRKQETASMTIRKVDADYGESLERQNARAAALQRYKMLVRSSRLVGEDRSPTKDAAAADAGLDTTPERRKEPRAEAMDADDDAGAALTTVSATSPRDVSVSKERASPAKRTTTRSRSNRLSQGLGDSPAGAAAVVYYSDEDDNAEEQTSIAAVSDDSDEDAEDVAVSAVSNHRSQQPRSPSRRSGVRVSPTKDTGLERSPAAKVPSPSRVKKSTAKSKSHRTSASRAGDALPEKCPYPVSYENETAPEYQPPEKTEPIVKPSHPRRDSIRPNFEPVRESTAAHPHHQAPPTTVSHSRKQRAATALNLNEEEEEVEGGSSVTSAVAMSVPPTAVAHSADRVFVAPSQTVHGTGAEKEEEEQGVAHDKDHHDVDSVSTPSESPSKKSKASRKKKETEQVPMAGGSSTAFWVRPNSALYEMTASIAAKRKDHPPSKYEEDMGYARIDSGSLSSSAVHAESKSRTSRRMSTRPEFDTRLTSRRSTVNQSTTMTESTAARRSSLHTARGGGGALRGTATAHTARSSRASSVSGGSNPQPLSHASQRPSTQALHSPRGVHGSSAKKKEGSAASARPMLSAPKGNHSDSLRSVGDAEGGSAVSVDSRVSDRQAQYFTKHCSRLASGRKSTHESAVAEVKPLQGTSSLRKKAAAGNGSARGFARMNSGRTSTVHTEASGFSSASQPSQAAAAAVAAKPRASGVSTTATKMSPDVSKRLQFDLDAQQPSRPGTARRSMAVDDDDERPSPMRNAPQATPRDGSSAPRASEKHRASTQHVDPMPTTTGNSLLASTPDEFHLSVKAKQQAEGTPSKSRRTERSRVASESPARDECSTLPTIPEGAEEALDAANRAALDEAVRRHRAELSRARNVYEGIKASTPASGVSGDGSAEVAPLTARGHSASLPTTQQSRTRMTTNEVVAAMLQGIVHQSRRVLPCYLCAEMQNVGTYALHLDICGAKTQMLFHERCGGLSDEAVRLIGDMGRRELPTCASTEEEKEAFSHDCYTCAKGLLVPCEKCGRRVRIHDAKEHELLCGRSYYENGKAGQRHREVVNRIESETE